MKRPSVLVIASEVLLVAGIIILVVSSLPFGIGCGLGVYNCGSYVQMELQNFECAIALLVVSAILFLYSALTTRVGQPVEPP